MLIAALISLSWWFPHDGQFHSRILNGILSIMYPQQLHFLLDGSHWLIGWICFPSHSLLYFNILRTEPIAASESAYDNFLFLNIPETFSVSIPINDALSTMFLVIWLLYVFRFQEIFRSSFAIFSFVLSYLLDGINSVFFFRSFLKLMFDKPCLRDNLLSRAFSCFACSFLKCLERRFGRH